MTLLQIRDLAVSYRTRSGPIQAVAGVDLDIEPGETVALVGESGSGKSTTAHAVIRLLGGNGQIERGSITFDGQELTGLSEREMRTIRGARIGLVPQDPTVSLNPVKRVGEQVAEVLRLHGLARGRAAALDAIELLERAGLPDPALRAKRYPHELSGGMRQRALIAVALAARPALLIADEPTSALDVTVQRLILDHLQRLSEEQNTAILLVTHDLGVAADRAQRIAVMSQGAIVETGPTGAVLAGPTHDYTRHLLASVPARVAGPPPVREDPLVVVEGLSKDFKNIRVVDDVSFTIHRHETLALVGESGSGKTTTARMVLRQIEPSEGAISFDGTDVTRARGRALRALRRRAQLIYQNPYASLDPRYSIAEVIAEPLRAFGIGNAAQRLERARELLDQVRLPSSTLRRRPAELSGGQRQRVAIARALALSPELVVCDEPVSALDVSVQAQVLQLLTDLQADTGIAYLFISHDLGVVRQIAHRVAVMRAGRIVETGPTDALFADPGHEYTRELLAAIPGGRTGSGTEARL